MARTNIEGLEIEYELLGPSDAPVIVLTPGGRFAKDSPGLPQLAEALVAGGRRVLLWDRPNCGASDISFDAESESGLHADTLLGLIRALGLGRVTLAGGSAGSRVSLIAASRDPESVSHLALWWVSGGVIGLMTLGMFYCGESAVAASQGGMAAVAAAPAWAEQIARNPANRDVILRQDCDAFIAKMQQWASFYTPTDSTPVPGMTAADFAKLTMPVLLMRNGRSDLAHTRQTSDWVAEMIPGVQLVDAPWPDDEWNRRSAAARAEGRGLFEGWPALAPQLLAFTG
ncbi:alpha/beta fold hydrolase [Sphingomonas bacterium]|uniref:alpha/beta fold hydrolase n=1 Tax=Sphingomonas bacterium TaxID=1895847 RepID=UPI001575F5E5|nr:alpha/beta hydrolase [Sphingomonas bacterium]